jgi:NADP-dependent 3-hydroxy acid dehydrogenase YdfG
MGTRRSLRGKSVFITGASSGIGEATARLCVAQGARVALAARRLDKLVALEKELGSSQVLPLACDVTNRDQVRAALHAATEAYGHLDTIVNNAGRGLYVSVVEMQERDWLELWAVNVEGALHVMQEGVPLLPPGGVLVNVSSIVAKVAVPYMGGYSATKAALSALSDALRIELSPKGIRVVTVYPGSTQTEFRQKAPGSDQASKRRIARVSADQVAMTIVRGIHFPRSQIWVTRRDCLAAKLAQRWPHLSDWVLCRQQRPQG